MQTKGLTLVHTGDGKGKTTAALGLLLRNLGWGNRCLVIQFLKSPDFQSGEKLFLEKYGVEFYCTGIGFSWSKSKEEQREALQRAWSLSKEKISDPCYDLIILDEINSVLSEKSGMFTDIISTEQVIEVLKMRPFTQNILLTGRNAPESLIVYADLVTEMKMIKHPYEKGIKAVKGIEY